MVQLKTPGLFYISLISIIALISCQNVVQTSTKISGTPQAQSTETRSPGESEVMVPTPKPTEPIPMNQADADVLNVKAVKQNDSWTFSVTVTHPDTGWEDYCDGWDIVTPDGTVLKVNQSDNFSRTLLHPHENEQPFTRSQSGIIVPEGISQLRVRAHDLVNGFGGKEITIHLDQESGEGFEVIK
jgi:hypothetical protein